VKRGKQLSVRLALGFLSASSRLVTGAVLAVFFWRDL
jgi:hypothetical protein